MTITRSAEKASVAAKRASWDGKQFCLNQPLGKKLVQHLWDNENSCREMKPSDLMQVFADFSAAGIPAAKFRNAVARAKAKLGCNAEIPANTDIDNEALGGVNLKEIKKVSVF